MFAVALSACTSEEPTDAADSEASSPETPSHVAQPVGQLQGSRVDYGDTDRKCFVKESPVTTGRKSRGGLPHSIPPVTAFVVCGGINGGKSFLVDTADAQFSALGRALTPPRTFIGMGGCITLEHSNRVVFAQSGDYWYRVRVPADGCGGYLPKAAMALHAAIGASHA